MRLSEGIEDYICFRRTAGHMYRTQAQELRAFGKYIGDVAVESLRAEDTLAFLDAKKRSRQTWRRKYSQLDVFFVTVATWVAFHPCPCPLLAA